MAIWLDFEAALLTADQARQNRCRVRVAQVVDGLKAIERNMRRMSAKAETA